MIELTRLNDKKFFLNPELIESLEASPDTTIRLTNGKTYVVKENCAQVNQAVVRYRVYLAKQAQTGRSIPQGWDVIDTQAPPEKGE